MATGVRDFALENNTSDNSKRAKVTFTFADPASSPSNNIRRVVYRITTEHYRCPGAIPTTEHGKSFYTSRRDANNKIVEKFNGTEDPKIKYKRHGMDLAGNFWSSVHYKEVPGAKLGPEHVKRFVEEVDASEMENRSLAETFRFVENRGEEPLQWAVSKS